MIPSFGDARQMYLLVGAYDAVIPKDDDGWSLYPFALAYRDFMYEKHLYPKTLRQRQKDSHKRLMFSGVGKLVTSNDPFFDEQTQWVGFISALPVGEIPLGWLDTGKTQKAWDAIERYVEDFFVKLFAKEGFPNSSDEPALFGMFRKLFWQVWNEEMTPTDARQLFDAARAIRELQKKTAKASQRGVAA